MEIAVINWVDSTGSNGNVWVSKADVDFETIDCVSCGIIINETKEVLTISLSESSIQYGAVLNIPKKCIVKLKRIKC